MKPVMISALIALAMALPGIAAPGHSSKAAVAGSGTVSSAGSGTNPAAGAKDMFYAQLSHPHEKMNNGVQCWIELRRDGQSRRVSNKFDFRSGDEIRFHVKTNTDSFAYIVLTEGSRGERAVLFPAKGHVDDINLKANTEYTIPGDGFMAFDSNPGTEKVTVILARAQVEPDQYMHEDFKNKVVIASTKGGSKDLIPGSFVVSMANDESNTPRAQVSGATNIAASDATKIALVNHIVSDTAQVSASQTKIDEQGGTEDATMTVVQRNPAEVLALDILLTHKP